jgi:hypothetical protein
MSKWLRLFGILSVLFCLSALVCVAQDHEEEQEAAGVDEVAVADPKLAVELGAPFRDNAVLQRDMDVPVWGWSKPGTKVTVVFAGQKKTGEAGADGKWLVTLDKLEASFESREMIVSEEGGQSVTLKNILVGEVWLASGQSNMQLVVSATTASKIKVDPYGPNAINPIREFRVNSVTAQLHPIEKATGAWRDGDYENYSAIAFAFAEKLYREINVPIGILNCSFSQTAIEAWVPREGWASAEDERGQGINTKCLQTDPRTPEHKAAWGAFYSSLEEQIAASEADIKQGGKGLEIGADVPGNLQGNRDATWLYNGLLHPVVPYAIRGGIWNQGYANMGAGLAYYRNLHNLIRGWRIVWDRPELPVYFHQFFVPGWPVTKPEISSTSEMRLGTWMARDIPHTGMASQIDINGSVHYHLKTVPGRRLALHALKNQYPSATITSTHLGTDKAGIKAKDLFADGPMFKSYKVKGDKVIVDFDFADGGLVVADTVYNRDYKKNEDATGFADPKIIPNGEDQVKLFWVAGEDKVWHPATFRIDGEKVIVSSEGVKEPRGILYGVGGIGAQPCLYNKGLLPLTPFIQYDHEQVLRKNWPKGKLELVGETIDPSTIGLLNEYNKMPLLALQFRDDAVLQAEKPVKIWGTTRKYGERDDTDVEGDCKIHFVFGPENGPEKDFIKKVIPVTKGMAEWSVTLPPMPAGTTPYSLNVQFTIDGELAAERSAGNVVFGDVWYVATYGGPNGTPREAFDATKAVAANGTMLRMIENQSMRPGHKRPSRFSIATSRSPRDIKPNGKPLNRFASYWKPARAEAKVIGDALAAKSGRPVGIIFMQAKEKVPSTLSQWMAPEFLKNSPSTMEDYRTVGSQYPDNPYYIANIRRYIAEWQDYWGSYIPEMIRTRAIPDGCKWGANWGSYPSPEPEVGDSKATQIFNLYVEPFDRTALKGIIFLTAESMVEADKGAFFGPEMAAVARTLKSRLGDADTEFIYTVPAQALAPEITKPTKIEGKHTAIEISDWKDIGGVLGVLGE